MNDKEIPAVLELIADRATEEEFGSYIAVCPICRRNFIIDTEEHYKYCPDCGQKLDWENYKIMKISEDEKVILRNLSKEYKYISRNRYGEVEIYGEDSLSLTEMPMFNHLFRFIRKGNQQHYLIEDLLKEETGK